MQILNYGLILLLFVLLGVAGLQFSYMFYLERLDRERKSHVRDLERRTRRLQQKLELAEEKITEQSAQIFSLLPECAGVFTEDPSDDEAWAEIIEEA